MLRSWSASCHFRLASRILCGVDGDFRRVDEDGDHYSVCYLPIDIEAMGLNRQPHCRQLFRNANQH